MHSIWYGKPERVPVGVRLAGLSCHPSPFQHPMQVLVRHRNGWRLLYHTPTTIQALRATVEMREVILEYLQTIADFRERSEYFFRCHQEGEARHLMKFNASERPQGARRATTRCIASLLGLPSARQVAPATVILKA